jgi:DNA-binding transcriptional LysR family regulator
MKAERSIDYFKRRTTLRQIEIVSMVRRTGSITAAAMALNTSIANVSRTCRRFEENSPSPVFQKTRKGVVFTEWGMSLMQEIKVLEDALIAFSANSDSLSDG